MATLLGTKQDSRIVTFSKSERHITQALNVVSIVGFFSLIQPTRNLTITFLIFFNPQPFEILLLAHDSASA